MRRIDAIGISLGVFALGGAVYTGLNLAGLDNLSAGVWSQVVLVLVLVGWTATYLTRVVGKNMTYDQQLRDYEDAVLQKRLDEMSPEEVAALQAEVAQERREKGEVISDEL
ncbi:MAG: DUF3007 domain-containing protein [Leptolyngbya foveolarum]|uniref:DUF3007 domain-containing protein n=1 Tax=Leptolyngbya foveolarum TaxID=47253 RepID=A0A2W4U5B3_9CYAN|nr:MAG: DUF3007 domain-containing protein [Leptolyngbya foveolarum]